MLAGLWVVYAAFGLMAGSMAPLLDRIRTDLEISRTAIGVALGAWPLVYLAVAMPAGRAIDRFGIRRSLFAGVLIIAASGIARALAQDAVSLWFAIALFGVGGPLVSIGAPKLVSAWFDLEQTRASGRHLRHGGASWSDRRFGDR